MADLAEQVQQGTDEELEELEPQSNPEPQALPQPQRKISNTPTIHGGIQRTITDKMLIPATSARSIATPRLQLPREKSEVRSDREFLDDLIRQPESAEYIIKIYRNLPSRWENRDVPRGAIHDCAIMEYDALYEEIIQAWGGGNYRCIIRDRDGNTPSGTRAMTIDIPTTITPPKFVKYTDPSAVSANEAAALAQQDKDEDESETVKELKRQLKEQTELDLLRERQGAAEQRRLEAELKSQLKRREIQRLQKEADNGTEGGAKIEQILMQINAQREQDRRDMEARFERDRKEREEREERAKVEAERKADEQRRETREMFQQLSNNITKVAEMAVAASNKPVDSGMKEMVALFAGQQQNAQQQTTQLLASLVPAITQKPADTGFKDVLVAMSAQQQQQAQQTTQFLTALATKPDTGNQQLIEVMKHNADMIVRSTNKENTQQQQMINGLMQAVIQAKQGHEMTPDLMLRIMDLGEKRFERVLNLTQNMSGPAGGEEEGGGGEEEGGGYDPKLGFLGNAGKALFYGLKKLPELAVQYPQLGQVLVNLVGTRAPSDAQLAQTAHRLEAGGMNSMQLPPPVTAPQHYPQPQMMRAPYPQYQMGGFTPPSLPPAQAPMMHPQQMNPMAQVPQQVAPQPAPQQAQPQQAQIDAATELEGESIGVDLPSTQTPSAQSEGEAQLNEALANSEARLRGAVTDAISQAVLDITDKVSVHRWPEDADDNWPGDFKKAIVGASDHQQRFALIQAKCDPAVWEKLMNLIMIVETDATAVREAKQAEQLQLYRDLEQFIEMNRLMPDAIPMPAAPVAQPQTIVTPPPAAPVA